MTVAMAEIQNLIDYGTPVAVSPQLQEVSMWFWDGLHLTFMNGGAGGAVTLTRQVRGTDEEAIVPGYRASMRLGLSAPAPG